MGNFKWVSGRFYEIKNPESEFCEEKQAAGTQELHSGNKPLRMAGAQKISGDRAFNIL
jgi:hypothetical protein